MTMTDQPSDQLPDLPAEAAEIVPAAPPPKPVSTTRPKPLPGGVPLWLPLVALIVAFLFAALIATRISSTLSALISPPQPVLPPGAVLQSQGSDSIGDWWLYKTDTNGCAVAKVYKDALGACLFNPSSGCSSDSPLAVPGGNEIAECSGPQTIGQYHVMWRVYLTAQYDVNNPNQPSTLFRIYRDIS